jgi:hypothetical protein
MKFIECLALAPVGGAGSQQKLLIMLFPRLVDVILLPNLDECDADAQPGRGPVTVDEKCWK